MSTKPSNVGYIKSELTGTAPNRILVCEYRLSPTWNGNTGDVMWQVQLHESGSKVVIVYGAEPATKPSSYHLGLGQSSTNFWTINPSTHEATAQTSAVSSSYSIWPGENRYYEFTAPTDPSISLSPSSATIITGFTKDLTATYLNVTGTPTITYSSDNTTVASVTGSGTSATVTGVSVGTATITATMIYNATEYTATCDITVEEPSYCSPTFGDPSDDHITNFATTGGETNIDNTSTYETGGYSDYYDTKSASITAGETLSCTVTPSSTQWSYGHAIWVDWNKNYEFEDDERVAYTTSAASGNWTGEFVVPTTTAEGDYRLRVFHVYNASNVNNPCQPSSDYGEGEDYKLTVLPPATCPAPSILPTTNITDESATLNWEEPDPVPSNGYNVRYRTAAYRPTYYFNDFNDNQVLGWTYSGGFISGISDPIYGVPGDENHFLAMGWSTTAEEIIISPSLTYESGAVVEFYYFGYSISNTFQVGYSSTTNNVDAFTWGTAITAPLQTYTLYSEALPAGTKYVAFKATASSQNACIFIDDFGVYNTAVEAGAWTNTTSNTDHKDIAGLNDNTLYDFEVQANCGGGDESTWKSGTFTTLPSCMPVTNLEVSATTTTTVSLTWTDNNGGKASYVVTDGDDNPMTVTNLTVTGCTVTGLTANTAYVFKVAADCGSSTVMIEARTDCDVITTIPHFEGFEGDGIYCWTLDGFLRLNNSDYSHAGTVSIYAQGSNTTPKYAVLPETADEISGLMLNFWYYNLNAYNCGTLYVGYLTDPDDLTTFIEVDHIDMTTGLTSYEQTRNYLFTGAPSGSQIALKYVGVGTTNSYVIIDDVTVDEVPNCMMPYGLAVSGETPHGATFSWTNGGSETEWHLYFSTDNIAPDDDVPVAKVTIADSNPFTVTTGLDPETNYYVWVRANCGGTDGYSTWVGPETFTTGIACYPPTGLAASEVTGHTAKLSWTGTSESYVLSVGTYDYTGTPFIGTVLEENFEDGQMQGWTTISNDGDSYAWTVESTSGYSHQGTKFARSRYTGSSLGVAPDDWLISPQIPFGGKFSFYARRYSTSYTDQFRVYVSTTGNNISDFTAISEVITPKATYDLYEYDLSSYSGNGYVAIQYTGLNNQYYVYVDDITITGLTYPIAWETYNTTDTQKTIEDLDPETPYFAKVKGNCGTEGYSQETAVISFTTDIACPAPTALTPSNPTSTSFDLQWTNGGAENWVVAYKEDGAPIFTEVDVNMSDVTYEAGLITYTLGGLDPETDYIVKVRDNCEASYAGDGYSEWTAEANYSTIAACTALNPVVSNITHHNATVNWEGESATGFTLNYRTAAGINGTTETFDGSSAPTGWEVKTGLLSDIMGGGELSDLAFPYWSFGTSNGVFNNHASLNIYGASCKSWLISPEIEVSDGYSLSFDLALTDYNGSVAVHTGTCDDDRFVVVIYVDGNWAILREWNNSGSTYVYNNISYDANGENVIIDLADYKNKTARIAFYGESKTYGNGDNNLHIDNVLFGPVVAAGAWQTQVAATTTADLSSLTAGTLYDVKVVPNCDPTLETETKQFKTMASNLKHFITAGDWGTAANWLDEEMPTITDNAVIKANATINNGTVATANNITFEGSPTPTLTINDGGQLKHNNTNAITATVKKAITGYGTANANTNNGYVLLAEPINSSITVYATDITYGIRTGIYDLYRWDRTSALEWTNYGKNNYSSLSMSRGTGYLYASKDDRELTFTGSIYGSGSKSSTSVSYTTPGGSTEYADFNLIGNPFVCDAYLADDGGTPLAYYKMNADGNDFETVTGEAIAPMQGVFYQATAAGTVYFYRELPTTSVMPGNLNIQVAQVVNSRDAHRSTDNAIIRFGEGNTLEKFSFNENNAKLYIPQDGKDYAVVNAENAGEIPVNFKAAENGTYTLSFNSENTEFSYLHLIDNMTGNDVNLLETPSYSFDARTIDYASRFKLVFATGLADMGDDFGFFDANGNLAIYGIEGTATLQVIDVTGRIISSETFSGNYSKAINAKAGIYMLRLIQGENTRTQKIVVK